LVKQTIEKVADSNVFEPSASSPSRLAVSTIAWALIICAGLAAYSAVLFNFACGDDYIHMRWNYFSLLHPEMIWQNFYTPSLGDKCSLYYRPLVSILMLGDYLVWGENGLGFRISNLTYLYLGAAFLW
jgi:hypothetical protein